MSKGADASYEVGYGKPPKHAQFKKGQSGNPRGRRKGLKNLATVLDRELSQKVLVTENGKQKSITKFDIIGKQLINRAAKADMKALKLTFDLVREIEAKKPWTASELLAIMDSEIERLRSELGIEPGETLESDPKEKV